jgi:predicted permease
MGIMREVVLRIRGTLWRGAADADLDEELRFHVDMQTRKNLDRGMSADEARRAALVSFGGVERFKEEARDEYRSRWLEDLGRDVRFGVRSMARAPLFSLLVIVTLALGIGANAAVFGVVKSVLLDALPYADAERLVRIYAHPTLDPSDRQGLSPGAATDLATRQHAFESVAPFHHATFDDTYLADGRPKVLTGALVGADLLRVLGVAPSLGRGFTAADAAPEAADVVLLSHSAWLRDFGGDSGAVGRAIDIDGAPHRIVGVLPRGFVGPMGEADLWHPLDLSEILRDPASARGSHWLGMVGRLRAGMEPAAARRDLASIAAALAREHPDTDGRRSFAAVTLRDWMVGETRTPLLVLMASATLLLLIACANLAGAWLSRTLTRRKEFAVRLAIGAGRGRLVRQLLAESALLALAGGVTGVMLAALALRALRELALPALPAYAELSLDRGAALVMAGVALVVGIGFGLAPALAAGRGDLQATLREESRGGTEGRRSRHLRGALVAGQLALSVSLLAGAGLLVRSLLAIAEEPLGYSAGGVLTAGVRLPSSEYPTDQARLRLFTSLEDRLRSLPGVISVGSASELPLGETNRNALEIEGVALPGDRGPTFVAYASVSDDYFRTMGIPLRRGRAFATSDRMEAPPAIVISESMARRYWPGGNALGARVRISPHTAERWGEVVGIVADVRTAPAQAEPEPMAYASSRQDASRSSRTFVVRTERDPATLALVVERELAALDPALPLRDPAPLDALLADRLAVRRLPAVLMISFAALALVLASVGVYAMFGVMVAAREREFGIRLALGSRPAEIARLVVRDGALWLAAGLAGGAVGIVAVAGAVERMIYGVSSLDPIALGCAVIGLVAGGAAALSVPVRRATRIDPIRALRG